VAFQEREILDGFKEFGRLSEYLREILYLAGT
jgi:hypothetical protein